MGQVWEGGGWVAGHAGSWRGGGDWEEQSTVGGPCVTAAGQQCCLLGPQVGAAHPHAKGPSLGWDGVGCTCRRRRPVSCPPNLALSLTHVAARPALPRRRCRPLRPSPAPRPAPRPPPFPPHTHAQSAAALGLAQPSANGLHGGGPDHHHHHHMGLMTPGAGGPGPSPPPTASSSQAGQQPLLPPALDRSNSLGGGVLATEMAAAREQLHDRLLPVVVRGRQRCQGLSPRAQPEWRDVLLSQCSVSAWPHA